MRKRFKAGNVRGFTMIEIVAVLVVVAVIAAIAINRAMSTASATRVAQESVIKNHIRYAQAAAMKQGAMS